MITKLLPQMTLVMVIALAGCSRTTATPTSVPSTTSVEPTLVAVPSTLPTTLALPTITALPPAPPAAPSPTAEPAPTNTPDGGTGAAQPTIQATILPAATRAATSTAIPNPKVDMRKVNWEQVVTTDPALVFNKKESDLLNANKRGPFVTIKGSDISGHALLQQIAYGDISGDGQEEAAIVLDGGGTGGAFGVVVFGVVDGKPKLIEKVIGYKMFARIEKGELVIPQPVYAGWEGNCCPSGQSTTKYILSGAKLTQTSYKDEPFEQAKVPTVGEYYALLNQQKYTEAYKFLSPAFQVNMPFDKWRDGYKNTTFSGRPPDITDGPKGQVKAQVVALEKTDNGEVRSTYDVQWALVWSSKAKQWLLDNANVEIAASNPSLNSALRSTNWFRLLTTDPKLKYDASVKGKDFGYPGPYLAPSEAYGHAMLESIVYGDFSGDGKEEAVIPLHSSGTAGVTGMLVYSIGDDGKPKLVSALPGYKMGATIQGGELRITLPIYAGWEPNCCPSGSSLTRYKIDAAGKLAQTGFQSGPLAGTHVQAVERFYGLLEGKSYKEAYALFSPALQNTQAFEKWQDGYKNTKILSYKVTQVDATRARAEITSQEGNNPAQKFFITWHVLWTKEWKLDKPVVQ